LNCVVNFLRILSFPFHPLFSRFTCRIFGVHHNH
jgi:hypothetical protein